MRDEVALPRVKFHQADASFPTEVSLVTPRFNATKIDADPREAVCLLTPRAPKNSICIYGQFLGSDQK